MKRRRERNSEDVELKKEIFKKIEENTEERPDKVIDMHFIQPVAVMKLVEIVRGLLISDETLGISKEIRRDGLVKVFL